MLKIFLVLVLLSISKGVLSQTAFVYNLTKNEVLLDENSNVIRPIASITKLMTTVVVVDSKLDLEDKIPSKGVTFFTNSASREDLLKLAMVKSDNYASEALATSHPGGRSEFILAMNETAKILGMTNTNFFDPTGLSSNNLSTAKDLVKLLEYAYTNEKIKSLSSIVKYHIEIKDKKKTRVYGVNNTNLSLMEMYKEIEISKTGTTNAAGKCLALFVTKDEDKIAVVLLGFKDKSKLQDKAREIFKQYIKY